MRSEDKALLTISERQIASFWKKMERREDGCWVWKECLSKDGYGRFHVTNHAEGPKQFAVVASRLSFGLTHGAMPNKYVLHSCDVPACCNPAHLREGSQKENIHDAIVRGRRAKGFTQPNYRGEAHHKTRITEAQARGILADAQAGHAPWECAKRHAVPYNIAYFIIVRRTWKWL